MGWPEATSALAQEKSKAEACVNLLKSVADAKHRSKLGPVYAEAKAISDGVIAGLLTVVAQRGQPSDLPNIRDKIEKAGLQLQRFCDAAISTAQASEGHKGPIDDTVKAAIGPIIDALKSAVSGIFDYWKETRKAEREAILVQLRDSKWPEF